MNASKPYPDYKPSSVEWLGDVPEHWDLVQLGRIGKLSKGTGGTKEDEAREGVPCIRYGDLYTSHKFHILDSRTFVTETKALEYTPVQYGDILFAGSGETIAEIGKSAVNLMESPARCGGDVILFRPDIEINTRFSGYAIDCPQSQYQKSCMGRGITVMHIYGDELKYLWIALPPLPEQAAIVEYLDYVDRRIRRYLSAKRKLIALLREEKQAIISQAVTRGLDPNIRLKPSGVEWLGDVPEHWEVRRIKSLSLVKRGASPRPIADPVYFEDDGEYSWVRIRDVTASSHYLERTTQRLSRRGKSLSVALQPGALFLSIAGSVGKPIITKIKCCIHDGFVYFPQFRGNAEFLYRVFSCGAPFSGLGKLGTQLNLNTDTVGSILLGWPALPEQAAIVEYLDNATAAIDAAVDRTRRQIDLVQEYRTRLIADVVTGKLDVREAAAQLPEEAGEEEPIDENSPFADDMNDGSYDADEPMEAPALESEVIT